MNLSYLPLKLCLLAEKICLNQTKPIRFSFSRVNQLFKEYVYQCTVIQTGALISNNHLSENASENSLREKWYGSKATLMIIETSSDLSSNDFQFTEFEALCRLYRDWIEQGSCWESSSYISVHLCFFTEYKE